MPLKISIGCCNHLFGEGLKKLLLDECNLDADSIITVSTNPREIINEKNDLLITDLLHKLKCKQCGSNDVTLKIISNESMPQLDRSNVALFSDNLRTV